ncbi:hypothetical protein BJ546DRAFT_1046051 [Cryomyces antarcticus]
MNYYAVSYVSLESCQSAPRFIPPSQQVSDMIECQRMIEAGETLSTLFASATLSTHGASSTISSLDFDDSLSTKAAPTDSVQYAVASETPRPRCLRLDNISEDFTFCPTRFLESEEAYEHCDLGLVAESEPMPIKDFLDQWQYTWNLLELRLDRVCHHCT